MPLLAAFLAIVGCAPPPYTADVASTEPSITITWPPPETSAAGCAIVTVDVKNFNLMDPGQMNGEVHDGEGHYHIITPAGYDACYAPYCISDFTAMASDQSGELRALIVDNNHQAVLDAGGEPYEASILFNFEASPTCTWSASGETYDTGDTGAHDSGS